MSLLKLAHRRLQSFWINIRNCQSPNAMCGEAVCGILANTYEGVSAIVA
jgi:hypothetical protein